METFLSLINNTDIEKKILMQGWYDGITAAILIFREYIYSVESIGFALHEIDTRHIFQVKMSLSNNNETDFFFAEKYNFSQILHTSTEQEMLIESQYMNNLENIGFVSGYFKGDQLKILDFWHIDTSGVIKL